MLSTRRQFLKFWAAVGGGLSLAQKGDTPNQAYYENKELLEQVVRKHPSPFVRNVIYDHTESLETRADYRGLRRAFDDPAALMYLVKYRDFFGSNLTEQDVSTILESSPLYKDALAFISRVRGLRINKPDDADAKVVFYPSDFGKGMRHDVFVFKSALDRKFIVTPQGDTEIPVEDSLTAVLEHEYTHNEDIANSINLGNGMVIDSSNYFDVHPMVTTFTMEERGYKRAVELAKRQFGENSGLYWDQLLLFMSNQNRTKGQLEGLNLSDYDRELIRLQMKKSEELSPDIAKFAEKFGR